MPPPLSQQQGSRAGLITTLVISIIFLLVSLILNFYFNSQLTEALGKVENVQKKYDSVIRRDFTPDSPELSRLNAAKTESHAPTLMDAAIDQGRQLSSLINGSTDTTPPAVPGVIKDAKALLASTAETVKNRADVTMPTDCLQSAISSLANTVVVQVAEVAKARNEVARVTTQEKAEAQKYADDLARHDAQVEDAHMQVANAQASSKAAKDQQVAAGAQSGEEQNKVVQEEQKALADKDVTITQLRADLIQKDRITEGLRAQLRKWRFNVTDPVIRQADARIIRVGSNQDVYIDLGSGERVTPGLTFEIYDKNEGIPKLGDGLSPDNMPEGKASIEVTSIGLNSSRCRIIKTAPGQAISEGDICVNLVYDRHTKYNFMVYGDFDMNGDGIFTAAEADMVKNLIVRWGGKVVNKINVDTDFLVLGKEPEVPQLSKEEEADPLAKAKQDAAKAALLAYEAVVNQAATLNIPIMNQNRFLYYTGYFDLVKR